MIQKYQSANMMDIKKHDMIYDELNELKEENFKLKQQLEIESKRFEELKNQFDGLKANFEMTNRTLIKTKNQLEKKDQFISEKMIKVNRADYELKMQTKTIEELRAAFNRTLKDNKEKERTISMLTRYIKKLEHDVRI